MSRKRHIAVKVLEGLLIVLVLLHLSLYVVFQIPSVQTWTARKVADVAEGKINGNISIGKISIVFFNRVSLYDVTIKGFGAPAPWGNSDTCRFYNPGDTLAHLSKMSVSFSALELLAGKLGGHRVVLEDGFFYLLREDTLLGTNLSRIFNFQPKPKNEREKKVFPDISVGDVGIKNCRFSIANPFDTKVRDTAALQMQYNNIRLSEMTGHFSDFRTVEGEIRCHIDELSAVEASGAEVKNMSGDFHLGPRGSGMDDMFLEDAAGSVIEADRMYFTYSSTEMLPYWVDSVVMDVRFRKSTFTFNSLKHFVPVMKNNNLTVVIEEGSEVKGPVADMNARGLKVTLPGGKTSVTVDAVMRGIPDMPNTMIMGTADVKVSTMDIPPLISDWTGRHIGKGISSIAKGNIISEKVSIDGPFRKMSLKGEMRCGEGLLSHWLTMNLFTPQFAIGGDVEVKSMDLGNVLGSELFGKTDFSLKGKVASGKRGGINLEYLNVDSFEFIDYNYQRMTATAEVSDTACHLFFVSRDDEFKIDINLDAFFDGKGRSGQYYCSLNAPKADLKALNLMEKDSVARLNDIHLTLDAGFDGENNAVGKLEIRDLSYTNTRGTVKMDSLIILSTEKDSIFDVSMRSPFFSADYYGDNPLMVAVLRVKNIVFDRQFGTLFKKELKDGKSKKKSRQESDFRKGNDYLTLTTFDTWNLTDILSEGAYLSENSTLTLSLSDRDSVDIRFDADRMAKKKNFLRDISLRVTNPADSIVHLTLISPEMRVGQVSFTDNVLKLKSDHGVIGLGYLFNDEEGMPEREMNLFSDIRFSRDGEGFMRTSVDLNGMKLYLDGEKWQTDTSRIIFGHKLLQLDRFRFYGKKGELKVNGIISVNPEDEMKVNLNNLDLAMSNDFFASDMNLAGIVSGAISIRDYFGKAHFLVDITGSDISFFDNPLGTVKVMSKWDSEHERMNLLVKSRYQDHSPINLSGYYRHPGNELYVNASLDELSLAYAKPFLKDILIIDGGNLSGHVFLMGKDGRYSMDSEDARFVNFAFTPVFTNVPYLMNGGMKFRKDEITFDGVEIQDRSGSTATLDGHIKHNLFSKMNLDVKLSFNDFECIDIDEDKSGSFYGTATASGVISATGPVNDILLNADIKTGPNTSIHVPITNAYAAKSNEILKFTDYAHNWADPYDSIMVFTKEDAKEKGKFRLQADATVYEDALVTIELDKGLGNLVECHGNAKVHLNVDPSRSITDLKGTYTVSGGKAKYVFAGIMAREFSLMEGGTLDFRGPLSNIQLEIGATYRTKTSISSLIADTSAVGSRQTVYASVGLKGPLSNPAFSFAIDIPDIDPLTRSRVETAFSTEAKVQQQFMALMLTGSFIRDEQSGISDNSNILYSNVSEMFSNQLNNVLRSLDVPIDVGLNYQKTRNQKDLFDVNVSYQAFNNRLVLNGSVGNGNRYQNWGGNFEAELKMDRRGKFRFSLFTRAADQYTNYLDNSQRNGFGFSFQDEFTRFREIFFSRKKRESYELEQLEQAKAKLLEEYGDGTEKEVEEEQK